MGKHWITLNSDTFLWIKYKIGLVYNTQNKKSYLFSLSSEIEVICQKLLRMESLYTAELTYDDLNNKEITSWVNSVVNIQAGSLFLNVDFEERPISLRPVLKVQDKKEYYMWKHNHGVGGEILKNLHDLTFYINGSDYGNNEHFCQSIFPLKDCSTLDGLKMLSFVSNSVNPFLSNINLVGNPFSYSDFEQFILNLSDYSIQCTIYLMAQDLADNIRQLKESKWKNHIQINILVDSFIDLSIILKEICIPVSVSAFVSHEREYMQFSNMFEDQSIKIIPLYNHNNLDFFEANVFIDKEELDTIELSKSDIFMRQAFNIRDFGKLTILPDGHVFANVNMPSLGTIDDSPYSHVFKEIVEGRSWFNIRNERPCNSCVYQWLCPSPSNYEIVIGRSNLCHINI